MSRGISDAKHVVTFANTSKRGRVCLFSEKDTTILALQSVHFEFGQVLRHIAFCEIDIYSRHCIHDNRRNNDHFQS